MKIFCLLLSLVIFPTLSFAQKISENEVFAFLGKSQKSFKEKKLEQILDLLTNDFTYEVFTTVDSETYDDKMDLVTYANYLRIFFKSNPDVEEYSDEIVKIKIVGYTATVELTTASFIAMDGVSQRCSGTAVYGLVKRENTILAKTIHGTSQCTMLSQQKQQSK